MFWLVLGILILFILYVIHSLSTIKNQLKQISKHLNVKDDIERVSNEEIEKELEDNIKM
jgi:cbb3-type cytochrome oxidase subunit 3